METHTGFEIFVAVVEEGGISAASRRLALSRPTLSRRLASLESELGVRLLHRSTRQVVPTPAGEELYRRARRIIADAREARLAVARLDGVPRGLLRVSVPPGPLLGPTFDRFLAAWPEVELEVVATVRHVDLVSEGFDVALRAGSLSDPSLIARILWRRRRVVFASADYVAAHGLPSTVSQLSKHVCIRGFDRGEVPQRSWPLRDGGQVAVSGRFTTNDLRFAIDACQNGLGLALMPESMGDAVGLVPVLPDLVGDSTSLSVVYPSRELLDSKVRAFVSAISADVAALVASGELGAIPSR